MRVMAEERASEESRRTRWPLPLKGLAWAGCRAGADEGAGKAGRQVAPLLEHSWVQGPLRSLVSSGAGIKQVGEMGS